MPPLLLKISVVGGVTKLLHFDKSMTVFDACRHIRAKLASSSQQQSDQTYGLFLSKEDPTLGIWLENGRILDSYKFKSAKTSLEYRSKQRLIRVCTLDGATRKVVIDGSLPALENIRAVCARIGIQNHQEFSFTVDKDSQKSTFKRADKPSADRKLDTLRKERHTHDFLHWVDPHKTLREQGLFGDSVELTLRKKYFFSDEDIGANDPVQLHLLYTQTSEAVTNGVHPVTISEALSLSALRCQEMYGDYLERKFQKGSIRSTLRGFLPVEYRKDTRKTKASFLLEYQKLAGLEDLSAKFQYIEKCRKLDTYGTSFFAVKEKVPQRNKLHPVLLGIKRECVLTLDIKTKEVLEMWELQTIHSYFSTPTSFCLNFGGYRSGLYIVKTTEGESIVQLLDGYIQLIQQTMKQNSVLPPSSPNEKVLSPKEKMQQVISEVINNVSQSQIALETPAESKIKKAKGVTIETSKLKLSALVSALLYSSAILWRETMSKSCDYIQISAAAYSLEPIVSALTDCSRLLASLGLTDKDSVRILGSAKALVDTISRLLALVKQDESQVDDQVQATLEDVASRATDLLAITDLKKGVSYGTYQSAAPVVLSVTSSVSRFLAETMRIKGTCGDDTLEVEIMSSVKDVRLSCQVLATSFTVLSSCSESPIGQSLLIESTQAVIESVHRLCFASKGVCLDGGLIIEIGASASTVASNLNSLITKLGATSQEFPRHPLEKSFTSVLAEARVLKSLLTRKQPRRKVLTLTKSFMLKMAALIQNLKSYYTIKDFDRKRELLDSLKKLLDEISVLVEGVKDTSLSKVSTDAVLSYLDESVSTVSVIVEPLLEQIRYTQFSNTVHTTFDSTLVLTVIVETAAEHSEFKTMLLEHCKKVEAKLRAVQAAFGTENHVIMWTDIREMFPYLSSLCTFSRALAQELYPKNQYVSEVIHMWSSHVQSQLYELKSILSKMMSYSGGSFEICSKSLKTLRESIQHPLKSTDGLDALSYGQTCHTLARSCNVFISLVSELTDRSRKNFTYTVLVSQTEKIVNSLLGLRQDVKESKSMELAVRLLNEMEGLGEELFNLSPLDLRLIDALRKTIFEIRVCLPLHQEFSTTLQKLREFQDPAVSFSKPPEDISLIDAIRSIHATISVILDAPNTSLEEIKVSLTNFTSAVQSILSIGKEKASCLDDQHRAGILAKLKRLCRNSCRIIHTATRVCYQPRVCPLALAPAARSLVSSLTDIALVLTSSGTERKNEYDLALMELEALNAVFLTESNVSVTYSTTSYSECYGAIVQQVKNIIDVTSEPEEKMSSIVQAVRNILDSAIKAAGLCSQNCENPYAHDYHMTESQMMMWNAQFLDICEQLLDPSLNSTQRLTLETTISMELRSMSRVIEYMASTLVGNINKRKLLQCMESLAMRVSNYLEVVKESTFESVISATSSLVTMYVVMESVYSTTAATALSVPNQSITVASSSILSSAMTWLRTVQSPQEQTTKPNEELAAFREDVQNLVTAVRENFIGRLNYARCLRQTDSFKTTLDAAVNETTKGSEGIVGSSSLHASVTKVRRSCCQMERKLKSIQSLPHVDCIGQQICETTIEMEVLLESVVKTCSLTPKSENTLLLVQHSSTCLEALSDILQWLNDLTSGDSELNDIDLLKSKIQKLLCGLDDLISLTLAISTKRFNPVSIMEIKRAAKRDEIPPFVFEDTDSDIYIHAQLTTQCHLLTKALNSMITEDTAGQMDLQLSVLLCYREISKIVSSIQGVGEEERECLLHSNQSLADTIAIVLQDIAILSLHPENLESRKSLKEAVKSVQEDVFRLVLLAQLNEDGAQWSAVDNLRSCVSNLDLYWVCSTYAQQSDIEQTDSQTRRFTSDDAQVLLEAVSDLVKVNEEDPDKLVSSVLHVSYTVSSIYESLEESYATMALSKCDLRIITALRDISIILVDLLKMSSGTCSLTTGNISSSLKLAQQAATSLLETVKEENQKATVVDTITATINHVDYLQTVIKAKFDSPSEMTYTDVVHSTTLLTLLAKRMRDTIERSGSIDEVVITECALLTRLTLTSLVSMSSRLISIVEDQTEKTELVQGKSECISSIQFVLLQLKTKIVSPNEVSMEVVSSSMDNITSFSQEMLEVFENIGGAITGVGPFQLNMLDYFQPWSGHHHITEDVDSPDGDNSDDLVIANTCGALLQALQSLVTVPIGDSLTPDKRFWVQSHIAMVSSLNLKVEGKSFNTHYLARMLLKMVADTLILWRVLDMPTNSDWLALVTSSKTLAQAIVRM